MRDDAERPIRKTSADQDSGADQDEDEGETAQQAKQAPNQGTSERVGPVYPGPRRTLPPGWIFT